MWLMQLGEVVFGGVGSAYTGCWCSPSLPCSSPSDGRANARISRQEDRRVRMKMAVLAICFPVRQCCWNGGGCHGPFRTIGDPQSRPHGLSEVLYAFSSAGNNNGSAFAG